MTKKIKNTILFALSDPQKQSIIALGTLTDGITEVIIDNEKEMEEKLKKIENHNLITFNGVSHDLPLLKIYDFAPKESIDLLSFFRKYPYLQLKNYSMKTLLEAFELKGESLTIQSLFSLFYKDKDCDKLKVELENHLNLRKELFRVREKLLNENKIPFTLDRLYHVSVLELKIKKDILEVKCLSLGNELPGMDYYINNSHIQSINSEILLIKTSVAKGRIDQDEAYVIQSNLVHDPSLTENFYAIKRNKDFLVDSIHQWIECLLSSI